MIASSRILLVLFAALTIAAVSCSEAETKAPLAGGAPKPTPTQAQEPRSQEPKPDTPPPATAPQTQKPPTQNSQPSTPPAATPPPVVKKPAEGPAVEDSAALAQRGRAVYTANCIACHNAEPAMDGAIGPAIAGSPFELIEARVMRNEYPKGYKPKRDTKAMIALPYLKDDLPAIAAFLAE